MSATRFGRTIRNYVVSHLTAWGFEGLEEQFDDDGETFAEDLEVMDGRLHLGLYLTSMAREDLRHVGEDSA